MASGRRSVAGGSSSAKPKTEPLPVARSKQAPPSAATGKEQQKEKVRIWWSPTDDKQKTGYGGAFWPAVVLSTNEKKGTVRVRYDNGEEHSVEEEHVSPYDLPVDFGAETTELQEGEFCEVHNDSTTDPGAWLGRVVRFDSEKGSYMVAYPFHDTKAESIKAKRIRRARILEDNEWRLIRPHQEWEDGEVASPRELELIAEEDLEDALQADDQAKPAKKKKKRTSKAAEAANGKATSPVKPESTSQEPKSAGPSVPAGMAPFYLTMEPRADGSLCFVPQVSGSALPADAIKVYMPLKAVHRYQSETKKRARS